MPSFKAAAAKVRDLPGRAALMAAAQYYRI
jgi:hypothetical protein